MILHNSYLEDALAKLGIDYPNKNTQSNNLTYFECKNVHVSALILTL
jgi:hypothetical protein